MTIFNKDWHSMSIIKTRIFLAGHIWTAAMFNFFQPFPFGNFWNTIVNLSSQYKSAATGKRDSPKTDPFLVLDGKYVVLPSGELQIRKVSPDDGFKTYKCRTKHRLTGETKLSATAGKLVITGRT